MMKLRAGILFVFITNSFWAVSVHAQEPELIWEEALFAGTPSGANVVAALKVAELLGPGKTVVTLLCDTGLKYLSTDLYLADVAS